MKTISKILRRKVLIRKKDFFKILMPSATNLYDRVLWEPLSVSQMQKDNVWSILNGKEPLWDIDNKIINNSMFSIRQTHNLFLYNPKYKEWKMTFSGDHVLIKPNRCTIVPDLLGIAILEKDR